MHAPHHVMFTPVERVLAHLLGLFVVTVLGRDLLLSPLFILFRVFLLSLRASLRFLSALRCPSAMATIFLLSGDLAPHCPLCLSQSYLHNADVCVCVCVLASGSRGSVVITRYQSLPLSPRESHPHMCYPVVLPLRSPWGAFRRGFQRVPRSLDSVTRSDVAT
jgi:hypothetical protein